MFDIKLLFFPFSARIFARDSGQSQFYAVMIGMRSDNEIIAIMVAYLRARTKNSKTKALVSQA